MKFGKLLMISSLILAIPTLSSAKTIIKKDSKKTKDIQNVMKYLMDNRPLVPTKVFDNVYCIGSVSVVAWAIQTTDGIILIDSMWDNRDAQLILDGMKKLGLDPRDVKYILISHGHGDHYGGAKLLKEKTGAKVVMSKVDYNFMNSFNEGPNSSRSPKAPVDIFANDKDTLTLGDTQITILSTPGHTPGGLSFAFPVKYKGNIYNAILWGGTGIPKDKESQLAYKKSAIYFSDFAKKYNANVELTAHLFADNGYARLDKVAHLKPNEKNPFILTKNEMNQYLETLITSVDEKLKEEK